MQDHKLVSRDEWLVARMSILKKKRCSTRIRAMRVG